MSSSGPLIPIIVNALRLPLPEKLRSHYSIELTHGFNFVKFQIEQKPVRKNILPNK
jgi:hypothetical protein